MKKLSKVLSVLVAAILAVTVIASTFMTVGAKGVFDDATTMKAMTYYSGNLKVSELEYYKIKVPSDGTLKLYCEGLDGGDWGQIIWFLMDSSANELENGYLGNDSKAELKDIKKGTYYIKLKCKYGDSKYKNLYYNFIPDGKTTVFEEPSASIAIYLEEGDSVKAAVIASDYDGKIKWSISDKSVATISNRKIIAKKAGKARIRAYLDDGSFAEIYVIVTND